MLVEITNIKNAKWYVLEIGYENGKSSVVGMGSDWTRAARLVTEWAVPNTRSPEGRLIVSLALRAYQA